MKKCRFEVGSKVKLIGRGEGTVKDIYLNEFGKGIIAIRFDNGTYSSFDLESNLAGRIIKL